MSEIEARKGILRQGNKTSKSWAQDRTSGRTSMYLGFKGRDPQIFKFKLQELDTMEARVLPFWSKATPGPGVSGSHSRRSTAPSFPPFLPYPYQRRGEPARRARLWFSVIKLASFVIRELF